MSLRSTLGRLPSPVKRSLQEKLYPSLLPEGETAPEWHLQSWDNSWHRHGKHWSLLVFYPLDGGAEDKDQLLSVQAELAALTRLGVKVFAFNQSEGPSHEAFSKELGLQFPLLTDRGGSVARQFRACLQIPTSPMYLRTVYLINPERKIRLGNRGNPSIAAIVRSVEALQQVSRTGM